jgi:dTDP-glucose 4,6-dehydratase
LTEALARAGADVVALVHYNGRSGWGSLEEADPHVLNSIRVVSGDIRDPNFVRGLVQGRTLVFHLAALIGIPYSYAAPTAYVETNIQGTLNVLIAARDHGVERVVHTSTSEVYGTARYTPIDEEHPLQGQSPYSASKIAADKLAESFGASFGLPIVTVRPFNTFGPRQSARAVIPTIVVQTLAGGPVRLGRLDPVRDLCFVEDTVRGFLLAAKAGAASGKVINLGTGRAISIGDLAETIFQLVGSRATLQTESERLRPPASEVMVLLASWTRARDLLGWRPEVALEEGLSRTIQWLRDNMGRYKVPLYNV